MNVAYDLRYAADYFSGIGTQAHGLIDGLLAAPGNERYTVLWNPRLEQTRFDLDAIRRHERVTWVECDISPVHPAAGWRTGSLLRALRPDVYLSPFHVLPFSPGCPRVLTVHDVRPLRMPSGLPFLRQVAAQWTLLAAARAERILTVSRFSRDEIAELSTIDPARVRVVLNGLPRVDPGTLPTRPRDVGERPFALVVGQNRPHKNLEVLARAWAAMGDRPAMDLVWAGPVDSRYDDLRALAARHHATGTVQLGWVSEGEREWLYAHAVLLLFPSTYEGFGFPMVESMQRGTPVIASRIPALLEVGGDAAWYCEPRDAHAWASAVARLAADAAERERLRVAGRACANRYSFARAALETLDVLHEVGSGRGGAK